MLYSEFVELAGYEVTYDDYKKVIEPMWLDYEGTDKKEFCTNSYFRSFRKETESEIREQIKLLVSCDSFVSPIEREYEIKYNKVTIGHCWFSYGHDPYTKERSVRFYMDGNPNPFDSLHIE